MPPEDRAKVVSGSSILKLDCIQSHQTKDINKHKYDRLDRNFMLLLLICVKDCVRINTMITLMKMKTKTSRAIYATT